MAPAVGKLDELPLPPDPPTTSDPPVSSTPRYLDVDVIHWAYAAIVESNLRGLMSGIDVRSNGDIRFDPEGTLTRAQVAQILYNAYAETGETAGAGGIADVPPAAWYHRSVSWAVGLGLIDAEMQNGGSYFHPDAPATRGLLADALFRMANKAGVELPVVNQRILFSDMNNLSNEKLLNAVTALQQAGVIGGFPDGTFRPQDTLTRAQTATLVVKFESIVSRDNKLSAG